MKAKEILAEIAARGIAVSVTDDGKLSLKAPKGAITEALANVIRLRKNDLLRALGYAPPEQCELPQLAADKLDALPIRPAEESKVFEQPKEPEQVQ